MSHGHEEALKKNAPKKMQSTTVTGTAKSVT
jgi:hypothetical protein